MISVVIVDDEALVASSLGTLLDLEDDIDVKAVLGSGEELLDWAKQHSADVIVTDLHLQRIDGIDAAAQIPDAKTVIITSHPRPAALKRALAANILGFLPKTSTAEQFAAAIRSVHSGKRFLDPEVAASAIAAGESPLTDGETRVLTEVPSASSIADIAERCFLAPGTVRNYLSSAMSKTGANNRHEAYSLALEKGWI